jgi:hypothetical protein
MRYFLFVVINMTKSQVIKELQKFPNVGPRVAEDLYLLGICSLTDLKTKNPDRLYLQLEKLTGTHVDRCMLYVLRALVYMAKHSDYRKEEVMWWNFKD